MGESLIEVGGKKSTNRVVGNQQMIKVTESYYTNKSSYKEEKGNAGGKWINKASKEEIEGKQRKREIEELLEEIIEERVNERVEERLRDILHGIEERSDKKMVIQRGFDFNNKLSKRSDGSKADVRDMGDISEDEANQSTVQTMVELWNKVFEHSVNPIKAYASKSNQEALLTLYKTIFNSDLNNWREYALQVNSSQFLMGEKETKNNFKAVFGWLIKPETVEKILSGEYGVGDRELDINNQSKNTEIKKEQKVTELENRVTNNLKENLNEFKEYEEFRVYIENEGYEEDNDKYKLGVVLRRIPKRNFLYSEEYKIMRDRLFESYLLKKHTDQSRLDIRDKLRAALNNPSDESRFIVTQEMPKQADYLEESIKTLELHEKKSSVNYQNKLTIIKTTKDREQSYGK
jgi:hypothetical protein